MSRTLFAVEQVAFGGGADGARVDEENAVIRGVKILGLQSKNVARVLGLPGSQFGAAVERPYRYGAEAVRAALPMYEGASVYSNHVEFGYTEDGRRFAKQDSHANETLIGWLEDVRFVDGQGLFGDLHYLAAHPFAPVLLEVARRRPEKYALSHEAAFAQPQLRDGVVEIGQITAVNCVVLVSQRPGTTNGLFESAYLEAQKMPLTLRELVDQTPAGTALRELLAEAVGDPARPRACAGLALETADGELPESQIRRGLVAAIDAALAAADAAQIKAVLRALGISDSLSEASAAAAAAAAAEQPVEEPTAEEVPPEEPPTDGLPTDGLPTEEPPLEEPVPPPTQEAQIGVAMNLVLECVGELNRRGVAPTDVIIEAMVGLPTPEKRRRYAQSIAESVGRRAAVAVRSQPAAKPKPAAESKPSVDLSKKGALTAAFRQPPAN